MSAIDCQMLRHSFLYHIPYLVTIPDRVLSREVTNYYYKRTILDESDLTSECNVLNSLGSKLHQAVQYGDELYNIVGKP